MSTNLQPAATQAISRRSWLGQGASLGCSAAALGAMATAYLLEREARGKDAPASGLHFPARAKRCIHIFSPGGVSHVDTFDYKPELERLDGQSLTGKGRLEPFFGSPGKLRKSFYPFRRHGESGLWVSGLLPHLAECADELVVLRTLTAKSSSHTPACFQMNTGFTLNGYPSLGAWLSYGLGTANETLPTFVVLPDPRGLPNGGPANWGHGFLPAQHQGTAFAAAGKDPVVNLATPAGVSPAARQQSLALLQQMNARLAEEQAPDGALAARIKAYELAAKMQTSVPEAVTLADESAETLALYGVDQPLTAGFGRNCLLARRLLERGVRFVQLYNGGALGSPRINWDAHEDLKQNHDAQGVLLDKPVAGLLRDLRRRGLLEDSLVFWSSEFGRTPFTQGENGKGRDHHNLCFTAWLCGAGLKRGLAYGESDEVGYLPAEQPLTVYDFHATILHLLGVDHTRLTYYHSGASRRLTDVHGRVIHDILA